MKSYIRKTISLCILLFGLSLCAGCSGEKGDEITWSRHAFLLEDDLVFIADVPENWRYIMEPVDDYGYYDDIINGRTVGKRSVEFVGIGENDSEDNHFDITVRRGSTGGSAPYGAENLSEYVQEPFVFQDGMPAIREYYEWEKNLRFSEQTEEAHYEYVYDTGKNYLISVLALKKEYDVNETEIKRFLESACFRTSNLGVSEETHIYKKELITLHLWDEYVRMSLQAPEGSLIEKKYYKNDMGDKCCSYTIYFDEEKRNYIVIRADSGEALFDSCGDTEYHLNVNDFEAAVYELTGFGGGYYFVNQHVQVMVGMGEDDAELEEYIKKLVQSIDFE